MSASEPEDAERVVRYAREVAAPAGVVFELIADPEQQPRWDGNNNLAAAAPGQRVHGVGVTFTTTVSGHQFDGTPCPAGPGSLAGRPPQRINRVVEFEEGHRIAWKPTELGKEPPGHLWRWEIKALQANRCLVTHTYDWSGLTDPDRMARARATTTERLAASVDRLAALAESSS